MPRLIVVVGPTASGKTSLAVGLAQRLGGEIVSADSQQCYRGLDMGTAKPTEEEQAKARHHLLDVAEPEEQLDAARFVELADAAIVDIAGRGKAVIVAGGTGLWVRALLKGLVDAPKASQSFREQFRREVEQEGVKAMHERLRRVDPRSAAAIRENDRVRIERALEVHALSGKPLGELQREHGFRRSRYEALCLRLDPPRELLHQRIATRTRTLFHSGALEAETRWLLQRGATKALKIIGYGECAEALRTGDFAAAEARVNTRTRQYAKRQRTWFAKEADALPWPIDLEAAVEQACQFLDAVRLSAQNPG